MKGGSQMEDSNIIKLYWDRDEIAITETSKKYGTYCQSIARNIIGNSEDAKECVNDTYLGAWNSIPPHRPIMLSTFLGKITRNLSFNRYKKNTAGKRGGNQIELVLDELEDMVSNSSSPEDEWHRKELLDAINAFLSSLSADKRKIFVYRYWYAERISDISKCFGVSENNVSVTLNRLRHKLHIYLVERGFEL